MVFEICFHITDFDAFLPDYHGISWWPMVGPSVRDRKLAQGAS